MTADNGSHQFERVVRKNLVARLALAAVLIAVVVVGLVIVIERARMSHSVAADAREGAQRFIEHAGTLLNVQTDQNRNRLRSELKSFVATRQRQRVGHFVKIILFDSQNEVLVKFADDALRPEVSSLIPESPIASTASQQQTAKTMRVAGHPFVVIGFPLTGSNGKALGYAQGIFRPSEQRVAMVEQRIWSTALMVLLVVVGTALVLYPVIRGLLTRVSKLSGALLDANLEMLKVLGSAIAKRDSDTDVHNYRVTIYSVKIAEKLDLSSQSIRRLIKGAFLHDVGKIGISDNILLKPGHLDEEEFKIMKNHVKHGRDIVERASWLNDSIDVVFGHHEKFDGSGYPRGLNGRDIPMNARIFAVADVFDALTSERPYKKPFGFDEAIGILEQGREAHFDPDVLDAFALVAKPLYEQFANRDDELPREVLSQITARYFQDDADSLLRSV